MNWFQSAIESWWQAHKLEVVAPLILLPIIMLGWLIFHVIDTFNRRK